jgi:hypothetical protein
MILMRTSKNVAYIPTIVQFGTMASRLLIVDVRYTDAVANQVQAVLNQLGS